MELSSIFSTDMAALLVLVTIVASAIIAYVVLLRKERLDTLLPPEHRHILAPTSIGMAGSDELRAEPSCDGRHDWKILHENVLPDDSSLITFWCRHCGALTLQRDDVGQRHTSTVWKHEAKRATSARPLILLHTLPELPIAWNPSTGVLTLVDTQDNGTVVLTPSFAK